MLANIIIVIIFATFIVKTGFTCTAITYTIVFLKCFAANKMLRQLLALILLFYTSRLIILVHIEMVKQAVISLVELFFFDHHLHAFALLLTFDLSYTKGVGHQVRFINLRNLFLG